MSRCPIPPPLWRNGCRNSPESENSGRTSWCPRGDTVRSINNAAGASPTAVGLIPGRCPA
eukprot:2661941-Rhodomonas_salina.1